MAVTFDSDWERFCVLLNDVRAAAWLALEDGAWRQPDKRHHLDHLLMLKTYWSSGDL